MDRACQGVVHGEHTGDGNGGGSRRRALPGGEADAGGGEDHVLGPQVAAADAIAIHGADAAPENAGGPRVIPVHGGLPALAEQCGLCLRIAVHGAVKVQVVPAEIGESGYSIRQAADAVKCQCVGGYLHHGPGVGPLKSRLQGIL